MKDKYWTAIIVAGWMLALIASSFYRQPSDWLIVSEVHVNDTVEGVSPTVTYSRWIMKHFRGQRLVEVNRVTSDGLVAVCRAEGSNFYNPGDVLPQVMNLEWLMGGVKCNPPPGPYVVDIVWTIRPVNVPAMEVLRTTNFYKVKPHGE